jgi:hypothetical protein
VDSHTHKLVCPLRALGVAQPGSALGSEPRGVTLQGITSSSLSRFRVGEEAGDVSRGKERLIATPPRG